MRVFNGYIRSKVSDKEWKKLWSKHSVRLLDINEDSQDPFKDSLNIDALDTSSLEEDSISESKYGTSQLDDFASKQ